MNIDPTKLCLLKRPGYSRPVKVRVLTVVDNRFARVQLEGCREEWTCGVNDLSPIPADEGLSAPQKALLAMLTKEPITIASCVEMSGGKWKPKVIHRMAEVLASRHLAIISTSEPVTISLWTA